MAFKKDIVGYINPKKGKSKYIYFLDLCWCGCGTIVYKNRRYVHGHNRPMTGKTFRHSEETKQRMSKHKKGQIPWNKGKKCPSICKTHVHLLGKSNPSWKGGEKISRIRYMNKRNRNLKFVPINNQFEDSEGHHLNNKYVLFIPKQLHESISHTLLSWRNMDEINDIAIKWYFSLE